MTYLALYRKYRPQSFRDVVGQEHITRTLSNALLENRLSHAYLFTGPRGTGKTTVARILAKAVNCLSRGDESAEPCNECDSCVGVTDGSDLDVLEIDAASNRGIDEIRDLRDKVRYSPARSAKKVYIIDEVHMLTNEAFNALLKTIEDPPEHCIFIFATTDPQRIPATILSRCQRFDFHNIGPSAMLGRLEEVCRREGIEAEPEALMLMVRHARGGMRDALGLLDQARSLAGGAPVERGLLLDVLGTAGDETLLELTGCALDGNVADGLRLLAKIIDEGRDPRQLMKDWIRYLRNLVVVAGTGADEAQQLIVAGADMAARMEAQAARVGFDKLLEAIEYLTERDTVIRWAPDPRIAFEAAWLRFHSQTAKTRAASTAPGAAGPAADAPLPAAAPRAADAPLPAAVPRPADAPRAADPPPGGGAGGPGPVPAASTSYREAPDASNASAEHGALPVETAERHAGPPAGAGVAEDGAADSGAESRVPVPDELTADFIKSSWPRVLAKADPQMKFYLQGLTPVALQGNTVLLQAGNKFLRDRMSDTKFRSRFENLLRLIFGQSLRIGWSEAPSSDSGDPVRSPGADAAAGHRPGGAGGGRTAAPQRQKPAADIQESRRLSEEGGRFERPLPEPPPEFSDDPGPPPAPFEDADAFSAGAYKPSATAEQIAAGVDGTEHDADDLLTGALNLFKARFVEPGPLIAKQWGSSSSSGGAKQ